MTVLFVAAISEFDQVLEEDKNKNRMRETLDLFENIVNNPYFKGTNVILLLNKIDIPKEKLEAGKRISQYFPEFQGPDGNYEAAVEFFKDELINLDHGEVRGREIFVHETCMVDEQNIRVVDKMIQTTIFNEILKSENVLQ